MEKAELVPDVLDSSPSRVLLVKFGNAELKLGNLLSIEEVASEPTEIKWESNPSKFYTLCFTDPDAPSRAKPDVREWVHWLVVNIPGDKIGEGETLIEFVPSCPGQDSGEHRYTFVLYEQPSKLDFSGEKKFDRSVEHRALRRHFSIRRFAQKYFGAGEAYAANFFTTQWDPYVNVVRKALGLP